MVEKRMTKIKEEKTTGRQEGECRNEEDRKNRRRLKRRRRMVWKEFDPCRQVSGLQPINIQSQLYIFTQGLYSLHATWSLSTKTELSILYVGAN